MKLLIIFAIGSISFLHASEKSLHVNMKKVEKAYHSFLAQQGLNKTERRVIDWFPGTSEIAAFGTYPVLNPKWEAATAAFHNARSLLNKEEQLILDKQTKDYMVSKKE